MNPATSSAASGSRIGSPARTPMSAPITANDDQTSLRVCVASAINTSLPSRSPSRDSYHTTVRLIATVTTITIRLAKPIGCELSRPIRWLSALRSTSITTSSRKTVTAAAATVSYLRCPYG